MSKKVSSKDVAAAAGVSQATVSYVLNGTPGIKIRQETRRAVINAARDLGYHSPHRALADRTHPAGVIGVAVDKDLPGSLLAAAEDGIKQAAIQRDSAVTTFFCTHGHEKADAYISLYRAGALDGVVFFFCPPPKGDEEALNHAEVPYILINSHAAPTDAVQVTNRVEPAMDAAITRFAALGAHEVAFIGNAANRHSVVRYAAYEKALARHGIPFRPHLVRHIVGADPEMVLEIARFFEALDAPPRAIFCDAAQTGFLTLRYAHQNGIRIPGDMAIVTIGTSAFSSRAYPSLSCVEAPLLEMGESAAKALFALIDARFSHSSPDIDREALALDWKFTERESTKGWLPNLQTSEIDASKNPG